MADDVAGIEAHDGDAGDVFEAAGGLQQARQLVWRQVHLREVAGDDGAGAEAQAGQEHQHLLAGGVLGFVEDDEGAVEGAAAHVGEGGDFDGAALGQFGEFVGGEHVVEGVVEGAEVGEDFLLEVAREEAQRFAGLHGGAGQDDAGDLVLEEGADGHGHRHPGLAGAGGAEAEGDVVGADGFEQAGLAEGAGKYGGAAGADIDAQANQAVELGGAADGVEGDDALGQGAVEPHAGVAGAEKAVDAGGDGGDGGGGAVEAEMEVTDDGADAEGGLQEGDVGLLAAQDVFQLAGVVEMDGLFGGLHGAERWKSSASGRGGQSCISAGAARRRGPGKTGMEGGGRPAPAPTTSWRKDYGRNAKKRNV